MNIKRANIWGIWVKYNPHILVTNEIIKVLKNVQDNNQISGTSESRNMGNIDTFLMQVGEN